MPFNWQLAPPTINWGQGVVDASAISRDTASQIAQMRAAHARQQQAIAAQMTGQVFQGFMGLAEQQMAHRNRLQLQGLANDQAISLMDREHQYGLNDWLLKNGLPDLPTLKQVQVQTGTPIHEQIQGLIQKRQDDEFAQNMQMRGYEFGVPDDDQARADDIERQLQELNNDPAYTYQMGVYTPAGEQIRRGLERERASLQPRWFRRKDKPVTLEDLEKSGQAKFNPDGSGWAIKKDARGGVSVQKFEPNKTPATSQPSPLAEAIRQNGGMVPLDKIPGYTGGPFMYDDGNGPKIYTPPKGATDGRSGIPDSALQKIIEDVYTPGEDDLGNTITKSPETARAEVESRVREWTYGQQLAHYLIYRQPLVEQKPEEIGAVPENPGELVPGWRYLKRVWNTEDEYLVTEFTGRDNEVPFRIVGTIRIPARR